MKTVFVAAALVLALASACGRTEERTEPVPTRSDVLAVINGQVVLEEEFEAFLRFQDDDGPVDLSRRKQRFRVFVTEQLILQQASLAGVRVQDEAVEVRLRLWLSQNQEVPEGFTERIRDLLTVQTFMKEEVAPAVAVTTQEMQGHYAAHAREYTVDDQAHVLEILVPGKEMAEDIRARARPGDVRTFKELARGYSQGLTAESGGDLGVFERGQLPENFEQVVFALAPGQISPVFQSQQGFHIFMMEEWVPRHPQKYYEVQDRIFEKLTAEKERRALDEYVGRLLASASIEVHDPALTMERPEDHANHP